MVTFGELGIVYVQVSCKARDFHSPKREGLTTMKSSTRSLLGSPNSKEDVVWSDEVDSLNYAKAVITHLNKRVGGSGGAIVGVLHPSYSKSPSEAVEVEQERIRRHLNNYSGRDDTLQRICEEYNINYINEAKQ